jgi:uncharacterized protein YceK|tara:strand:- start:520 stop:678 length:159 start_codon:yes stop_codon:yes gene_type:complete
MKIIFIILFIILSGCGYNVKPDTTTVEYGTSENGKDKITKGVKQTFKWGWSK